MQNTKLRKAFTIVELLVVMAVIGILVTLAVVGIQAIQKSQRGVVRDSDVKNFQGALESYYLKFRHYPHVDRNLWTVATGGSWNSVRYDNVLPNTGLCLMIDGSQALSTGKWSTTLCDVDASNSDYFVTVKFSGLGMGSSNILGWNWPNSTAYFPGQATNDCNWYMQNSFVTVDTWLLMYDSPGGQTYLLGYCDENGLSKNFGASDLSR